MKKTQTPTTRKAQPPRTLTPAERAAVAGGPEAGSGGGDKPDPD